MTNLNIIVSYLYNTTKYTYKLKFEIVRSNPEITLTI